MNKIAESVRKLIYVHSYGHHHFHKYAMTLKLMPMKSRLLELSEKSRTKSIGRRTKEIWLKQDDPKNSRTNTARVDINTVRVVFQRAQFPRNHQHDPC